LTRYETSQHMPSTSVALEGVLGTRYDSMAASESNQSVLIFVRRYRACVKSWNGHFEHVLK